MSEPEIAQNQTHLQQGGYPFQSLWICFLIVCITHQQKAKSFPEICQKHLKDILAVTGFTNM